MATPSGTIGLSDVNAELDLSPTALISLNDAAVRTLAGVPSGVISMQNLQNKSNRVTISLTISANTTDYDVFTNRGPSYDAGKSDITVTINSGVTVSGTSTGSAAFRVPAAFNPADTVTIINNGTIVGRGGAGGSGLRSSPIIPVPQATGGAGGPGLLVSRPITLQNINRIAGGGGGGGGGGGFLNIAGGSGGGGVASGSGGPPTPGPFSEPGNAGQPGTLLAGGAGGAPRFVPNPEGFPVTSGGGGAGGGFGASGFGGGSSSPPSPSGAPGVGKPGGSPGAAITGNPLITYSGPTGTRNGPIS